MIEKCSLGNMNNNMKIIGLILLFCILFIVIIYYFRSTLKKHNDIVERFDTTKATIVINGGNTHPGKGTGTHSTNLFHGGEGNNEIYNGEISMRKCQVYFVGENEQSDCDTKYNEDPLSTNCKYEFKDGWNEINTIKNNDNTITVPKKIYNKEYTNIDTIANSGYMTACYKDRDTSGSTKYLYDMQDNVVMYGSGGSIDDATNNNKTLRLNVKEGNKDPMIKSYISKHFGKTGDIKNDNLNMISSICSIGYNDVVPTDQKNFYKFNLEKNGNGEWVLKNMKDVKLNEDQTTFEGETDSKFIGSTAYGIYFESKNTNSVSFSVFESATLSDKDVKVYKFKYNYICNDKILQYDTLDTKIIMTSLLNITGTISDNISFKKYIINYDNNIINSAFWDKVDFKLGTDNIKKDRSKIVFDKLTEQEPISLETIENTEKYSVSSYDATILRTNNLITSSNTTKDKFHENITMSNLITLNKVNTNIKPFDFKQGYFLDIVNQESPFVNGNPINVVTVSCISPNNIIFGTPGLIGEFYEGYYNDDLSFFDRTAKTEIIGSITNFHTLRNLTNNGNGLVDWRKRKFQSGQDGGREGYSLKWHGKLYAPYTGTYQFYTYSDDASHVLINGKIEINNQHQHGMSWKYGRTHLTKGTINSIEIYFGEDGGGDEMYFWWAGTTHWAHTEKINNSGITCIYNSIETNNNFNYSSKNWVYNDGEYLIDIMRNNSSSPILLSSLMIDNKNIIMIQTNDLWRLITSHSDGKYNYYYKNTSDGNLVQLKAILKVAEINNIVSGVVRSSNQTFFDTLNIDNFRKDNNIKLNAGWNRTLSKNIFSKVIITGYVFLQKGDYTFYSDIDIASNNIIYKYNKLYIENLNSNNNISIQKLNVTNGGFRKFSLSCFVLLKDVSNINFIFSARLYTDDKNTIDINLYDYIYGGDKLYNFLETDNTVFNNLLFNNNTKDTMSSIVKYLHDRHDYWDIKTYMQQKEKAEETKREINGRKSVEKEKCSKEFKRVKELFKGLDFSGFTNTTDKIKWFNTAPPTLKNNILPSSIFNLYDEKNYITYEKIHDVFHRTPTIVGKIGSEFKTNFQIKNTVNTATIYVLNDNPVRLKGIDTSMLM